ncbi:DUF2235 domain-containing protein [Silanimonas sp.]|uniref:DUF2235 domain-containing protein n=1 Tax=Silanimonas sp. TaxID=1929290 RepID=UPI0022CAAB71|nr:DUF2235 domain-containing protein [Silanimonas sp.]MCZ8115975.1 DUF2235 domain-containing protein [Silanimonas sp.]
MKRIVLCADGTWNESEEVSKETGRPQPTNVLKVARAVKPLASDGVDQIVYYHKGVGTLGKTDRWTGGAFGNGMELNVRDLYRFLVYNYEPGDQIYLFGFSRGAFTVRTLVGFMAQVGLLEKDDEFYTRPMYALYESSTQVGSDTWNRAFKRIQGARPMPPIEFIGVWDTVGALGVPGALGNLLNRGKYKYHDIGLHPQVRHAYHALAIDERRKPFAPSLFVRPPGWTGVLEQAWFPGVHSNVGGSYSPDGLANEALHWMVEKAEQCGLQFDSAHLAHYRPCFNSTLNDSMSLLYRAMVRELGAGQGDGQCLHQAALDRAGLAPMKYAPQNLATPGAKALPVVTTRRIARGTPC